MMRRAYLTVVVALAVCSLATPSRAAFHVTVIDEVMTSYNGDAGVQFIEMRMLAGLQSFVANSVLAAFDANGNYVADIIVVPNNVTNSGIGVRWLVGTAGFQTQSSITPDFVMPAGILPAAGWCATAAAAAWCRRTRRIGAAPISRPTSIAWPTERTPVRPT